MATIVTREFGATAKGSPLTNLELDNNFTNLNSELSEKISYKQLVRVATTTNITLADTQIIDGVALVVGDRVLVKDQILGQNNGIYTVQIGSWTRASDSNTSAKLAGAVVNVDNGSTNQGRIFRCSLKTTDTLGTTIMLWTRSVKGLGSTYGLTPITAQGIDLNIGGQSITLNSGNLADLTLNAINAHTIAATAATTYTRASTLYIDSAPIAGTNVTITNPYAIYVANGATRLASLTVNGTTTLNGGASIIGVTLAAGSTALAPIQFTTTSANLLSTATPAAMEVDNSGNLFYTDNSVTGRGHIAPLKGIRLTADVTPDISTTASNWFGASNAGIQLEAGSIYEIVCEAYFLKTTAGTVTFQWVASSAPTYIRSRYDATAVAGFTTATVTTAAVTTGQAVAQAVATLTHATSGSLTTGAYHLFEFRVIVATNAATTLKLQALNVTGTLTPKAGSFMYARKLPIANVGVLTA